MASRLLPLIPLVPALSALVLAWFGGSLGRRAAGRLASGALCVCFVLAALGFAEIAGGPPDARAVKVELFEWISLASFRASAALVLDPLASVMTLVITSVGFLVHVYSIGYLQREHEVHRYFAYLNLLTAFMLLLVLAENLLVLFLGWEGVGLCCYLLVGYRGQKTSAIDVGMKAFIVDRFGDVALLGGILMTFVVFGTVSFQELLPLAPTKDATALGIIGILVLVGAIAKSAQIPFHVWLLDTVEGPPPASALIQSATIVTAGVYLVARTAPLFAESPLALGLVGAFGAVTALSAAALALAQDDLRRALAYSTVSQVGCMFMACGVGAFGAAVFHLVTHAFSKALLFLCAGSVMHAMAGRTDVRGMGGLKEKLPVTYRTFVIATLGLTAVPPFAGFFSETEVLWSAFRDRDLLTWGTGVVAAFLTALYMGRLWMLVFGGRFRGSAKETGPSSELPGTWPLLVLAVVSAGIGFIGIPHYSAIAGFLASTPTANNQEAASLTVEGTLVLLNVVIAASGLLLARRVYRDEASASRPAAEEAVRLESPWRWLRSGLGVDALCDRALVRPLLFLGRSILWRGVDRTVIDRGFHGSARLIRAGGEGLRLFQSGNLRFYLFVLLVGVVAILAWMMLRARWAS
ncbi:MAG: NADH-quinone oxidoreductase subunit L [Vicinamibacteria bacterium]